ncbi:hypothetical protein ABKN59_005315 [Abortiporus biennis]
MSTWICSNNIWLSCHTTMSESNQEANSSQTTYMYLCENAPVSAPDNTGLFPPSYLSGSPRSYIIHAQYTPGIPLETTHTYLRWV